MRSPLFGPAGLVAALALAAALTASGASAGAPPGDVHLELRPTARVRGTIRPAGERERFFVSVPGGSRVDLDALAKTAGLGPDVSLVLGSVPVAPGQVPFKSLRESSRGLVLRGLQVARTDTLAVEIVAAGVGEYALSVRAHPQLRWRILEDFSGKVVEVPTFSAPLGASAVLTARPAKGSTAQPVIALVDGTDTRALGRLTTRLHSVVLTADQLAPRLDHLVTLEDASGLGEPVQLDVVVRLGGVPRDALDLRGTAFGLPRGGEVAAGRIVAPEDAGDALLSDDLGLVWEAPRFEHPVRLALTSAEIQPPEVPSDWVAVGGAYRLDTEGEESGRGIELRIPLTPGLADLPRDAGLGDLAVLSLPDEGPAEIVAPGDRSESRVRLWTRHPGRYVVVAPAGPGRVHGSSYWAIAVATGLVKSADGNSTGRFAELAAGRWDFSADVSAESVPIRQRVRTVTFDITPGAGAGVDRSDATQTIDGTWAYDGEEPGGVVLGNGVKYAVSGDGAYLAAVGAAEADAVTAQFELLVRRDAGLQTYDQLAGDWDLLAFAVQSESDDGRLEVGAGRAVGTLTIDDLGRWRLAGRFADVFNDGSGVRTSKASQVNVHGTSQRIAPGDPLEGGFELGFEVPGGGTSSLVCLPGAGGRVMVGRGSFGPSSDAIFVATWRGPHRPFFGGSYIANTYELEIESVSVGTTTAGDWEFGVEGGACDVGGPPPGDLQFVIPYGRWAGREPSAPGGVSLGERAQQSYELSWRVLRDGTLDVRGDGRAYAGAVDASGGLMVFVQSPSDRAPFVVFGALVRR